MRKAAKTPGLFSEKERLTRRELRQKLKEDRGVIPGKGGERYHRSERVRIETDFFPWKKYGKHITRNDYQRMLLNLKGRLMRQRDEEAKTRLERKIRYLKKIGGV